MTPASVEYLLGGRIEVQVWRAMAATADHFAQLDTSEQARAARFVQQADRDRFVTGRVVLRRALAHHHGLGAFEVPIEIDAQGRPFCPLGSAFSLSHSGDLVVLALSPESGTPLGIDVERLDRMVSVASLARVVCTPAELAWLCPDAPGASFRFLDLWTNKEAALKLVGTGLALDPRSATWDAAGATVNFAPETMLESVQLTKVCVPEGYVAALAYRES